MLLLKIMFWFTMVEVVIQAILCRADHPRQIKPKNLGTDIVLLIVRIALLVFFWGYAFGGWTLR